MQVFDRSFLDEMKERFEIDLAGATTIESSGSAELEGKPTQSLRGQACGVRSFIVAFPPCR